MSPARLTSLVAPALLVVLCVALYLPFLGNGLVFDDKPFFYGRNFARYATTPLGLELRLPGYFSLAIVEVLWGRIEAHRVVSLALHAGVALALYKLTADLLRVAVPGAPARFAAVAAAAAFAVHPVAVYGAGYLIQRTGMLAALFGLVSAILFLRGLTRRSHADAVSAAALFSLAVLSKETAVLVPAAALAALCVARVERRFALRHAALYLAACVPAATLAVLLVQGKIGTTYEPDFGVVASQVGEAVIQEMGNPWTTSALMQLELFFRYMGLWLWPKTTAMSIDVRVVFDPGLPALVAFVLYGAACAGLLWRGGRAAVVGFGLAWFGTLFLVELTTVRFADPYVLYRSYLWAPGLAVALAGALAWRRAPAALLFALPVLAVQAHDRLESLSSGVAAWQDAAAKLPAHPVPGGSRTLYQLGREHLYGGDAAKALAVSDRCIAQYPGAYDCHYARAAIHVELGQHGAALPFVERAVQLRPESGSARHLLGFVLESLGEVDRARESYQAAVKLGFGAATHRLQRLEDPSRGLAPTRSAAPPPG